VGARDGFDDLVAAVDPAMVVVTTALGDERSGCVVGFHAQSSIEPRRYTVWLSRVNHTYRVALLASHVAVHFLTDDDRALAELFGAETGDDVDKFARTPWTPGPAGVPLLDACPHRLVGRRITLIDDGGDHVAFVTEPVGAESRGPFRPLRLAEVAGLHPGHEVEEDSAPVGSGS
jgi:flavin reductase (DIM6/NTAB) family NADH-FMN oxidoreductase RutF